MNFKLPPITPTDTALSLQIAKNNRAFQPSVQTFRVGFQLDSIFSAFFLQDRKKNIPQNIVSTHTGHILHIEDFFCDIVRTPTDDICPA
ncbi:MAG: hypothetical protein JSW26_13050 [Desulfobacterales bacterium]|nr:MAG: hypothetical protein JSW26_13050 [Desulfobacterales bacterium]